MCYDEFVVVFGKNEFKLCLIVVKDLVVVVIVLSELKVGKLFDGFVC